MVFLFVREGGGEKRASQNTIQKIRRKNHGYNKKRRMTAIICGLVVILAIVADLLMSATPADVETLNLYKGLLYVKHGRVGTRMEGPDYYLQTFKGDYLLQYKGRLSCEPDYYLKFYCRKMAEVKGKITENMTIQVEDIHEICNEWYIPQ